MDIIFGILFIPIVAVAYGGFAWMLWNIID